VSGPRRSALGREAERGCNDERLGLAAEDGLGPGSGLVVGAASSPLTARRRRLATLPTEKPTSSSVLPMSALKQDLHPVVLAAGQRAGLLLLRDGPLLSSCSQKKRD
jgi:hypothetical protein